MNNTILESNWNSIIYTGRSSFEFKRIDSACIPELNIGLNSFLNRCLLLELPPINSVDFQTTIKQKLTIEFFKEKNYIVIQLTDSEFNDLFNDLIISLYYRIKNISNVDEYSRELIHAFYKWSEFFEEKKSDRLSIETVKGLIGELIVLRSLIKNSNSTQINDILNSWKGPYDKGHDFELDIKDIEVKTKDVSKLDVKISSEYQLDKELGKILELVVITVEGDPINGTSVKDLVLENKALILERLGDSSILLKAISQKGLTLKNMSLYDNFRFKAIRSHVYDCSSIEFPKLNKSNIPKEINGLSYNIRVSELDNFIVSKTDY
jgi:hypothetical protein